MAGGFEPERAGIFERLRGLFGTRKAEESAEEEPAVEEPPPVTPVPVPEPDEPPDEEEPAPEEPEKDRGPKDDHPDGGKPKDDDDVTVEPPGPTSGEVVVGGGDDDIPFEDDLVIGDATTAGPGVQRDPAEILDRIGGLGPDLPGPRSLSGADPALALDGADESLGFDKGYLPPDANAATTDDAPGGPDTAARIAHRDVDAEAPDVAAAGDPPIDTGNTPSYQPGLESVEGDEGVDLYDSEPVSDSDQGGSDTLDDGAGDLPPDLID